MTLTSFIFFFPRYKCALSKRGEFHNYRFTLFFTSIIHIGFINSMCTINIIFRYINVPFLHISKKLLKTSSLVSFLTTGILLIRRHNLLPYCSSYSILLSDVHMAFFELIFCRWSMAFSDSRMLILSYWEYCSKSIFFISSFNSAKRFWINAVIPSLWSLNLTSKFSSNLAILLSILTDLVCTIKKSAAKTNLLKH